MPLCQLMTSIAADDIKDGIESRLAEVISKVLEKPLERVTMIIQPGLRQLHRGSLDPACLLTITSAGVFDAKRNPKYGPALKAALQEEFNLPPERCAIQYRDFDLNFAA
ncbi:macrophage migration inhibitory factor [Plakobranchus ocellatus]|uniref:D-dopachrome decarboxylase n=1 Tax=Plakobranchus ocellatus TaxID=259542 RepID=A0AAV4C1U1_9GAST|nr:macrophage migration inhibitory factor [Plakobranchus ocellatus]